LLFVLKQSDLAYLCDVLNSCYCTEIRNLSNQTWHIYVMFK